MEVFTAVYVAYAQWRDDVPELLDSVELRLAEYTSGHWSEPELREELAAVMPLVTDARSDAASTEVAVTWALVPINELSFSGTEASTVFG
jgi:hypothetical protein